MASPNECQRQNFGLQYDKPKDFVEPQSGGISRLYICYRLVMATFFCSTIVHSMMYFPSYSKWFVYLTHWSYTVIAANTFLQAVYVTRHYVDANNKANDKDPQKMTLVFKVIWVLHNITFTTALLVSAIYWAVVYQGAGLTLANTSTHIANSIYVLVDISFTAIPVRIAHVLHVLVFAIVYVTFTVIYWAAGGTNADGKPYIYTVINYGNKPSTAADWLIGVFVAVTFLHFAMYALYRLRVFVYDLHRRHRVGDVSVESAKRTPEKRAEEYQIEMTGNVENVKVNGI